MNNSNIMVSLLEELAAYFNYDLKPKNDISWSDIYWYQFPRITNLAAGATSGPVQIVIQDDSHFEWMAGTFQFNIAQALLTRATQPIPNMALNIVETGSGKQLMNANVPVTSIFGMPGQPITLPQAKVLSRNSVIQITAQNYDAGVATGDLWLTLIGRKLYNVK